MASPAAERYLATFSPEDQAAIRAGGDVDAWYQAAIAANSVPGQGTAAPQGGWANATAEQAGINPWQQDYKQEFARTTGQDLGKMSAEQRARWSMEHLDALDYRDRESAYQQWMAWQDSFDPNCPSSAPYQAEDGSGCVEKPDNSNKGYQQQQEQGGAGGAGGAGKGGPGAVGTVANPGANDLQRQLEAQYAAKGGIFSPANQPGIRLNEGGLLWTDQAAPSAPLGSPAPAGGNRGNRPRNQGNEAAALPPPDQSGQAALIGATLNAFGPKAPSATGAGEVSNANPSWNYQPQGWTGQAEGGPGNQALVDATGKYMGTQPGAPPATAPQRRSRLAWWQGPQTA